MIQVGQQSITFADLANTFKVSKDQLADQLANVLGDHGIPLFKDISLVTIAGRFDFICSMNGKATCGTKRLVSLQRTGVLSRYVFSG